MMTHTALSNALRFLSADAVEQANSGHPGLPLGMADVATVLFTRFLKFDASRPDWPDRDRFVLSAGHGSALLYALSYLCGYPRMTIEEVRRFRQLGSLTPGHPEHDVALGIEMTTGPLGQGIATAVGMALAERMLNARFGSDLCDHYTYVLASDGDMMEGISHEAASLAGHLGLSRLIVLYDDNGICIDGPTSLSFGDDTVKRFDSYGWATLRIDGHNPDEIAKAIEAAQKNERPTLIACKTTIGFGAPTKAGSSSTHGSPLGKEELAAMREKLGWKHPAFEIPADILSEWRRAGSRHAAPRLDWEQRHAAHPQRDEFTRCMNGHLPASLAEAICAAKKKASETLPKVATRQSSGTVLETLVSTLPELVGGSADLTPSNNTKTKESKAVSKGHYDGRYLHFGVREHGMATAMNGLALHGGFIPYGGTFLTFTDYSRPAIRLAALMHTRVVHVMTHDSIGLGEDGPTHQPVEHLAALRTIPNTLVLRPCDTVETAECWEQALRHDGPSILALSRQALPTLRTTHTDENLSAKGGYVLAEASGERQVTLLATGSEVSIALEARAMLEKDGIPTAVVSLPGFELFDRQPLDYRQHVLGPGTVRIGIEAALRHGWDKYLGPVGDFIGMTGFGASAPADQLYRHFGITAEAVAHRAKHLVTEVGDLPKHKSHVLI
jgi:transketolase